MIPLSLLICITLRLKAMACVYPPGCFQSINVMDPTSESRLLEIKLIPTKGWSSAWLSEEGLLHMKEMLEGADKEMELKVDALLDDTATILFLGVDEDDPKEFIDDEEVEEALEQWRACVGMDDLHKPSYFSDYAGYPEPVFWCPEAGLFGQDSDESDYKMLSPLLKDDRGQLVKFTPEMLEQREQLNWNFNFLWNGFGFCEGTTNHPTGDYVPPIHCEDVEIVTVGDNHGVGKCKMGSVFIPKGALNYLGPDAVVGQGIQATLERANEGARYPWRIVKNGITCVGITYGK